MTTELGTFAGHTAYWGYSEDYDAVGLAVGSDFYEEGDLVPVLYRYGSMGAYFLIYATDHWKTIPPLVELAAVYERWGIG